MNTRLLLAALCALLCSLPLAAGQWGEPIRLFNGRDLGGWRMRTAHTTNWTVANGELVNLRAGSNLVSAAVFGDFKLHLEFNCPPHSNSGVYLRGRYEVQIATEPGVSALDRTGAIYNVLPAAGPDAPAGEWASLDIELTGRTVTVALNGHTLIDRQQITKLTGGALDNRENEPGPIFLQGDHGPIRFRNILLSPTNSGHGHFERTWEAAPAEALPVNAAEQMLDPEFRRQPESRSAGLLQIRVEEAPEFVERFEFTASIRAMEGVKTPRVIVNGRSTYFFPESDPAPRLTLRPRDLVTGLNALQFTCDQKGASPGRFLVDRAAIVATLKPEHPELARHRLAGCEFTIRAEPGPPLHSTPACMGRVADIQWQPAIPSPGAQARARLRFRSAPGIEYVTAPREHR